MPIDDEVQSDVVDFLNQNSATATRVWSDSTGDLLAAVSVTRYPYDIFAAAFLGIVIDSDDHVVRSTDALSRTCPTSSPTPTPGPPVDQIGTAFRRGDYFVLVLTNHAESVPAERAAALAADMTRLVGRQPAGRRHRAVPLPRHVLEARRPWSDAQ